MSEDSVLQGVLDLQGAIKGALVAAVIVVSMIVAAMASWMAMQVERIAMQTVVPIQTLRDMTKTLNDKSTEKITPEKADALLEDHAHNSPELGTLIEAFKTMVLVVQSASSELEVGVSAPLPPPPPARRHALATP